MGFSTAIQAAIFDRLSAYSPLTAAVVSISDNVPQANDSGSAADYPYVSIGEDVLVESATDTSVGAQGSVVIHTWSRARGRKETKEIQGHIFDALSRHELVVTGFKLITIEYQAEESFLDPDGLTRHGVSTFSIIIDE